MNKPKEVRGPTPQSYQNKRTIRYFKNLQHTFIIVALHNMFRPLFLIPPFSRLRKFSFVEFLNKQRRGDGVIAFRTPPSPKTPWSNSIIGPGLTLPATGSVSSVTPAFIFLLFVFLLQWGLAVTKVQRSQILETHGPLAALSGGTDQSQRLNEINPLRS
jgi:hypothetical protein